MANGPREPKIFFGNNPDAGRQLRERLERLSAEHEEMKECNRVIREHASDGTYAQMDALMALGYSRADAEFILQPGDDGKPGYSRRIMRRSYTELHRLRRRLEEFEKLITKEPPPPRFIDTDAGPVVVIEKYEEYLLQFKFTRGVPEKTREILRSHGFHWSWESLAFERALTDEARGAAEAVLEEMSIEKGTD